MPRTIQNVRYDFSGQVVLVTGAARGQGRAHAIGFGKAGASVIACDVCADIETIPYSMATASELEQVAKEVEALGARCVPQVCDVRDSGRVQQVVEATLSEFGRIDVLINNAGVTSVVDIKDMTDKEWDAVLDVQLGGFRNCARAVAPTMISQRRGKILTTGSVESFIGLPSNSHYVAAKHAMLGLTRGLAVELAPHRINVNIVCPGGVDTAMASGIAQSEYAPWFDVLAGLTGPWNLFDHEAMMEPEEITQAMLWLASDAADSVTGVALTVDCGFTLK